MRAPPRDQATQRASGCWWTVGCAAQVPALAVEDELEVPKTLMARAAMSGAGGSFSLRTDLTVMRPATPDSILPLCSTLVMKV